LSRVGHLHQGRFLPDAQLPNSGRRISLLVQPPACAIDSSNLPRSATRGYRSGTTSGQQKSVGTLREFCIGRFSKKSKSFAFSISVFTVSFRLLNPMNTLCVSLSAGNLTSLKNSRCSLPVRHTADGPLVSKRSVFKVLLGLTLAAMVASSATVSTAATVDINPSKDNTLYEYVPADGDRSNALGLHFFTGETGMGEVRRGVLAFDISAQIPPGSIITGVTLTLNMSMTPSANLRTTELHKLLADWGEGTSQASGGEGSGAPATTNDATWRHRFFDTIFWTSEGGDFSDAVSASQLVGGVGVYAWSSPQMIADVQSWLDNPITNFGWLVLGDESAIGTAKRDRKSVV